jgi:hypothetical protein
VYDPNAGRFLSRDPLGLGPEGANLYGYVRNNPTNMTDPSGMQGGIPSHQPVCPPAPQPYYQPIYPQGPAPRPPAVAESHQPGIPSLLRPAGRPPTIVELRRPPMVTETRQPASHYPPQVPPPSWTNPATTTVTVYHPVYAFVLVRRAARGPAIIQWVLRGFRLVRVTIAGAQGPRNVFGSGEASNAPIPGIVPRQALPPELRGVPPPPAPPVQLGPPQPLAPPAMTEPTWNSPWRQTPPIEIPAPSWRDQWGRPINPPAYPPRLGQNP